jgi:hypothetical protein
MPFFFILAALPAAGAMQFGMAIVSWVSEKHAHDARTRRLLEEVQMVGAVPGAEQRLAVGVRKLFDGKGTSHFRSVSLGGIPCRATDEQMDLLNEALEGADDNKVRTLLALIVAQGASPA